ncbi:ATP-binding protein [Rubrobacter calidifluminis]|uniref:ATP-binding protein n=1 Tax=Rubrobacter calidifluminis TaxID=1392640 RepID=UPI00235FF95F|nr:ATP-binding protein [Rubrobacter calidifluminis]
MAVYGEGGNPEIMEISASGPRAATSKFTRLIMEHVAGGFPEEALREILENLIHADYRGVVVSILDGGRTVRVSDRGPGIRDKVRAMEFGFSGASPEALRHIRGVGAGLGIAREAAVRAGGKIEIEDNIGTGTVVTISTKKEEGSRSKEKPSRPRYPDAVPKINLSERQQKTLLTVMEEGEAGPSTVAEVLEVSVSTAYRDLSVLEEQGLLLCEESGKRVISPLGRDLVQAIVSSWV